MSDRGVSSKQRLRVLVVDDSAVVREVLSEVLQQGVGVDVVTAADPLIALRKVETAPPNVVVLDLKLPHMDGMELLDVIMRSKPLPVVICSAHTGSAGRRAVEALRRGAVAVINKPQLDVRGFLQDSGANILQTVRDAAKAAGRLKRRPRPPLRTASSVGEQPIEPLATQGGAQMVIAMGASAGGTEALTRILQALPGDMPGIVVTQHMPAGFTEAFARQLDSFCRLSVREARSGDRVEPGVALIAPGDQHMRVVGRRSWHVELDDGPTVNRHKPSVDVLFSSVARAVGAASIGVILTGMGDDGARGMLEMHRAGAATMAQDESSCVVFGMPKEAIRHGGVDRQISLNEIPKAIMQEALAKTRHSTRTSESGRKT